MATSIGSQKSQTVQMKKAPLQLPCHRTNKIVYGTKIIESPAESVEDGSNFAVWVSLDCNIGLLGPTDIVFWRL
jgi:hypothetical protein